MSTDLAVRHALLRDDVRWDGSRIGLSLAPDGTLALARVPAPAADAPVRLDPPFDVDPSGIAVDAGGRIYLADTAGNRIVMDWTACGARYTLRPRALASAAGLFSTPAGLTVAGDALYVADSGNARVLVFLLPGLELRRMIAGVLSQPTGLAADRDARLYVLDRGLKRVLRFGVDGAPDAAYNAAMAAHAAVLAGPAFLALAEDDTLFVSDEAAGHVLAFDRDGRFLQGLAIPAAAPPTRPRALAAYGDKVYVADTATGSIMAFDRAKRIFLGSVPGFRGPVAAMAFDADGHLFVKTDGGDTYCRFQADAGCIARGTLTIEAEPLDAGVENDWERIAVDADRPAHARVTLETYISRMNDPAPSNADWRQEPALDMLLSRAQGAVTDTPGARRFLWLRVTLESTDGRHTPTLRQVHAQTPGDSYFDQLPRIYRRDDAPTGFVERLLALARSEIEDWNAELEGLFRRFDPATAPADGLAWLATWLALVPPRGFDAAAQRRLLARAPELYARRGTLAGLRDFAEIFAGVRPHIFEAHRARHVWQLETSSLGFDTALAAAAPDGLIVPGQTRTDPAYAGLRGDYYAGVEFDREVDRRTDRTIDFHLGKPVTPSENTIALDRFSVRWSGQIKPRYAETYTFHATPAAGVRLWVDGLPLIDSWNGSSSAAAARITLDGARWYPITLEMHRAGADPVARLEWSSRSQPREVIPAVALYSVQDDRADLEAATAAVVDVGNAVVGASGPLAASEYGATLFADYAHLFTVVVPAASCRETDRRSALRDIIDAEKPAHTDYHLCFAGARMRVGFQARLGIDAIVAEGPPPLRLDETTLGRDSYLAGAPPGGARVGARARLGQDTIIG